MELFGGAGHSFEIINRLSKQGLLIGIDRDRESIDASKQRLKGYSNVIYIQDNYNNIKNILENLKIDKIDGMLLDLGVSSYQLDEKTRGFSYMLENDLDMRMDKEQELTAKVVVNTYKEERLANLIYEYGEERFSKNIAKNIVEYRKQRKIETTKELVSIIDKSIPEFAKKNGHPAKRTFQAIRIEVNDEIKPLYNAITNSIQVLKNQGRLAVITFHSIEDRIVKNAMFSQMRKMYLFARFAILCM